MSDLLKRKPKKIERSQTVAPRTIFTPNDLPEPTTTDVVEKKPVIKTSSPVAEKTTTVRVSIATKNKLNAMVTLGIADTVDQLTDVLIDDYVSNILSKDQKKQFEIILDLYKSKINNK